MSFFNQPKKPTVTTNFAGGKAYAQSTRMELLSAIVTSLGNDNTYEKFSDRYCRLSDLVKKCDPEFVAKLAVYARTKFNVRTTPIVLLVEMARHFSGSPYIRLATRNTITRADELSEVLSAYVNLNGHIGIKKLCKLNNGLRRGIADAFHKFNEYQFSKYKKTDKEISLRDAFFISHPKPLNDKEAEVFAKIANETLSTVETWETKRSAIGQNKELSQEEKDILKRESWGELLKSNKLGYMAMLRNLCNMLKDGVDDKVFDTVINTLADKNQVKKSKQFPFRFYSAYNEVRKLQKEGIKISLPYTPNVVNINIGEPQKTNISEDRYEKIYNALEQAAISSVTNIPGFENKDKTICVVADVSGSMDSKLNEKTDITFKQIGLLMSILINKVNKKNDYYLFASEVGKVNIFDKKANVFDLVNKLTNLVNLGYSTNGYKVFDKLVENNQKFDKIYLFTDMQLYGGDTSKAWSKYRNMVNKDCELVIIDLSGYGKSPVAHGNNAITIPGFSEQVFEMIELLENGSSVVNEIMKIELK